MEKTEEVVVTETTNEETGNVDTQTTKKDEGQVEVKTISKEEADNMVRMALKKKLPPKEEMDAFKEWKESQKTEADKQAEKIREEEQRKLEFLNVKQENIALKKGIDVEDIDYVIFKVAKLGGEFEENLDNFLKENPKYLSKEEQQQKTDGTATKKISDNNEGGVMAILKEKHPNLFN